MTDNPVLSSNAQEMQQLLDAEKQQVQDSLFGCFHNNTITVKYTDLFSVDEHGEPLSFKPAKAADWIVCNYQFKTDINTGILYIYNGKTWIANAEPYLEYLVNVVLADENNRSRYENIEFTLKAKTYQQVTFSHKVSCENGLLDVETGEFTEFKPEEMSFHQLPVKYDPDAECPNWLEFINQVVTADDKDTLQEWSGYCLLPDYRFHKIMWVVGSGRNGKGVWQRTIEGILGTANTANVGLEEFDGSHRFALVNLYGKLVNFCSEPKTNRELQTNLLKYATGQDTIEAEIKNRQNRLSFKNTAKITVLANKFPKCNDQTTAFKERRLFLKFPNQFIGKEQITNLEQIWLNNPTERSGILNWMLQGLRRLLEQGYFTTSRTQEQTELEFLRVSDSVSAFINEAGTFNRNVVTTRTEAKEAYELYCDYYGLECESEKKLAAKLKDTPHVKDVFRKIAGKTERVWLGIAFKKLEPTDEADRKEEAEQQTLEVNNLDTHDTLDTGKTYSLDKSENKKVKEYKIPVSAVSTVSTVEPVLNDKEIPKENINYYKRLAPNDIHHCDGLNCEHIEAEFKTNSGYWCKTHLAKIMRDCSENGYLMREQPLEETGGVDY